MFDKLIDLIILLWERFVPIVFIAQYESAVVMRGGKYIKNWEPGNWYFRLPFVDEYYTDNIMFDTMYLHAVNITTLDGKTISIGGEFDLCIVDIEKALVRTHEWRSNLQDVGLGIMSNELEDIHWDDIRKKTTKNAIEKKIAKRAEEMGILVTNFNFTDKALSRVYKLFNS